MVIVMILWEEEPSHIAGTQIVVTPQSIPRLQNQRLFNIYYVSGTGLDEEISQLGLLQKRKETLNFREWNSFCRSFFHSL